MKERNRDPVHNLYNNNNHPKGVTISKEIHLQLRPQIFLSAMNKWRKWRMWNEFKRKDISRYDTHTHKHMKKKHATIWTNAGQRNFKRCMIYGVQYCVVYIFHGQHRTRIGFVMFSSTLILLWWSATKVNRMRMLPLKCVQMWVCNTLRWHCQ